MKPMHASKVRISRCPCCVSVYAKHRAGTAKMGKTVARTLAKKEIKNTLRCE